LILCDEDGIETLTTAQLMLQPAHNAEQADAALRTSLRDHAIFHPIKSRFTS